MNETTAKALDRIKEIIQLDRTGLISWQAVDTHLRAQPTATELASKQASTEKGCLHLHLPYKGPYGAVSACIHCGHEQWTDAAKNEPSAASEPSNATTFGELAVGEMFTTSTDKVWIKTTISHGCVVGFEDVSLCFKPEYELVRKPRTNGAEHSLMTSTWEMLSGACAAQSATVAFNGRPFAPSPRPLITENERKDEESGMHPVTPENSPRSVAGERQKTCTSGIWHGTSREYRTPFCPGCGMAREGSARAQTGP